MKMNIPDFYYKLKRSKISLDDWLLEKNIYHGQREYQRFVILTRSRAGSNFLCGLLQSHTRIRAFEEIFPLKKDKLNWGYANYPKSLNVLNMREEKPLNFLDEIVFRKYPKPILAVGFKLFYWQGKNDKGLSVWDYLQQNKSVKIIHLRRQNLLRVCLSLHLAKATNQWILKDKNRRKEEVTVVLDYEDCLRLFTETKSWEEEYNKSFRYHSKIEILYEDLVRNQTTEINLIQDFLGVGRQRLKTLTVRQNQRSLSATIENYNELKEKFTGTQWQNYFEE